VLQYQEGAVSLCLNRKEDLVRHGSIQRESPFLGSVRNAELVCSRIHHLALDAGLPSKADRFATRHEISTVFTRDCFAHSDRRDLQIDSR